MRTAKFEQFVAPAVAKNQLWRLILGVIVIAICWVAGAFAVFASLGILTGPEELGRLSNEIAEGSSAQGMFWLFLTFGGLLLGTFLAAKLLHGRGIASLFGPASVFWDHFVRVLAIILVIYTFLTLAWMIFFDPVRNLDLSNWIKFLGIGLAGLALQTLAEEVAFRGYLLQQLAARFRATWIWLGVPTVLFGLLHYTSEGGPTVGILIILATGLFGLVAIDLTRRTGSLGAAWGLHLGNNIFALFIVAIDGNMQGAALWVTPYGMHDTNILQIMLVVDITIVALTWYLLVKVFGIGGNQD